MLRNAQKESGSINRENLSQWVVALIELSVALTTVIAARAGMSPAPVDLQAGLARLQQSAQTQTGRWGTAQRIFLLPAARGLLNLLFTTGTENVNQPSPPNGPGLPGKVRPVFKTSNHHQVVLEEILVLNANMLLIHPETGMQASIYVPDARVVELR